MECEETLKFVHVYLDGEFAEDDRRDFEKHLQVCEPCRMAVSFERQFKAALRSKVTSPPVPAGLEERIRLVLASEPEPATPSRFKRLWLVPPAFAAAAAAAVVVVLVWPKPEPSLSLDTTVSRHERAMPLEVRGPDARTVSRWYQGKVLVPIHAPSLANHGVELAGGRLVDFNQKPAAYLIYYRGGRKVAMTIFDPSRMPIRGLRRTRVGGREAFMGRIRGHNVALFRHGGAGYAITSDLPQEEIRSMVRTVVYNPSQDF